MPGADEVLKVAADRGWEAMGMVVVLIGFLAAGAWIGKWLLAQTDKRLEEAVARESRLAARITSLEGFVETTLTKLVMDCTILMQKNIETINALTTTLNARLCFADVSKQDALVDRLATKIKDELKS